MFFWNRGITQGLNFIDPVSQLNVGSNPVGVSNALFAEWSEKQQTNH